VWTALLLAAVGVPVAITAWQGCSIYGPDLLLPAVADSGSDVGAGSGDGGREAGIDAGPPGTCGHQLPPSRPSVSDASAGTLSVVAAIQAIDVGYGFGAGDAGPTVPVGAPLVPYGWDLDDTCTCLGSPPGQPSCVQMSGTSENCDDDGGVDHIALELFRALGATAEQSSLSANQDMHAGLYGLLIQITGYNGLPDDGQVTLAVYASNGVVGVQDGGTPTVHHDGTDEWTVNPAYIDNGAPPPGTDCDNGSTTCVPVYVDTDAYVVGGQIVSVGLGKVPLTFGTRPNLGGAVMELTGVVIVGTLVSVSLPASGEAWAITNGSIAGRWATTQLLSNLSTIPDPKNPGQYFCGNDEYYPTFKEAICALQDIAESPVNDNMAAPCNALSMGFGFQSEPAHLGPVYAVAAAPAGCLDDAGLPWQDSCR
jgi:hypothetical protein